jgi:hypothetical protein
MVVVLAELLLVLLVVGLLVLGGWAAWAAWRDAAPGRLPSRERAELAAAIQRARWVPGHDEVGGVTRVLLRKAYTGLDGHPVLLEERVLESFPAQDPAWEALFTEAMSRARFRCTYLNAEESRD